MGVDSAPPQRPVVSAALFYCCIISAMLKYAVFIYVDSVLLYCVTLKGPNGMFRAFEMKKKTLRLFWNVIIYFIKIQFSGSGVLSSETLKDKFIY